jgi:putative FmdB family regulatory protein
MPEYLYFCETCQEEFEATHSITINLKECPKCHAAGLPPQEPKRLIAGGTQFILSGNGWGSQGYSSK